ncbi:MULTISPECIES: bifunctional enoyl-CoA hydratase/phosphate acetyltransferase [Acidobacterium]|uniref:Phosphate acetyltransferase n=1 Tax=Acidobacterium capsulatum (strain ATCC 51196 / DSM 11244 / BCRC 80197 / JCM 7670 / NBRC 15755 / NCIMB 13165 / 161) TaxID=240015 RepID=C1F0Y2_ACIC5|nr:MULTISPECIES: bifunctional enoyl-CoA hydratase/phosphate acetyltransferase [Acidobacterium]ACO33661.1 phosphate acetyltransferase [Acidobacterium capsulatum ATCC 51196]
MGQWISDFDDALLPGAAIPSVLDALMEDEARRSPLPTAVCWPCSAFALAGALDAAEAGVIEPILVAPAQLLAKVAEEARLSLRNFKVIEAANEHEAARVSAELCRSGEAGALMKGSLHTDVLMHAVLARDSGLRTTRRVSHVFVMDAPLYNRTLFITDAAINIYPTLDDKVDIAQNAIDLARRLGVAAPRVAILSAAETVCSKITSTLDAAALCKMADRGQITGGILDGPLALDTAVSAQAAEVKQLRSEVAGKADILLVPDLESGNMLAKQLEYLGGAQLAGIVLGAKVPVILTSRADPPRSRVVSCAIAALLARDGGVR